MQELHNTKHQNEFDDEINLRELFYVLLRGKFIIVFVTALASILGIIYSLSLPNIYQSKAILAPVESSSISGSLGAYASLSGLAGINLGSDSGERKTAKAIEKLRSLSFFENKILPNIYLPNLMAVKSWDPKTNMITFDENLYDIRSNTWVRDFSYLKQQIPSPQESYGVFKTEHFSLSEDKKSGFITLTIKHHSPFIAKQWAELIVNEVNNFYRLKDKSTSERAISYLNQQISQTSLNEVNNAIADLIQEEIKKLTLIEAHQYYVFDYIDPPAVMEKKSEPRRSIICIFFALLGGVLSIFIVFLKYYVLQTRKQSPEFLVSNSEI